MTTPRKPEKPNRPASAPVKRPASAPRKPVVETEGGMPAWGWWAIGSFSVVALVLGVSIPLMLRSSPTTSAKAPRVDAPPASVKTTVMPRPAPAPPPPPKPVEYAAKLDEGPLQLPPMPAPTGPKFRVEDDPSSKEAASLVSEVIEPAAMPEEPKRAFVNAAPKEDRRPWVQFAHKGGMGEFGIGTTMAAPKGAVGKLLTYSPNGATSTTVAKVDNLMNPLSGPQMQMVSSDAPIEDDSPVPTSRVTWMMGGVEITERLKIVEGAPVDTPNGSRRFFDTVLVRYTFVNKDKRSHRVAFRQQIDTLIGRNDGVPFAVPGKTGIVTVGADFRYAKDVPDFLQALEIPNLQNPGTVANVTLRVPGVEKPDRASLTHWAGGFYGWDVPLRPMGTDSALVLYWSDKMLEAGKKREIGYEYGLGAVTSSEGRLGITLSGSFEVGGYFTIAAYVQNPTPKQTLTLTLPKGLEKLDGAMTQPVPPAKATSIVTWKAQIKEMGNFEMKVTSNDGLSQTKTLSVGRLVLGDKLALDFEGPYERGGSFKVLATTPNPAPGQTVTLELPPGLSVDPAKTTQPVPAVDPARGVANVEWMVKGVAQGSFPITIRASTGPMITKTLKLQPPAAAPGTVTLAIDEAGPGLFALKADVHEPDATQKVTLVLPPTVERTAGEETVSAANDKLNATWKIKAPAGRHAIEVKSTVGDGAKKFLVFEEPTAKTQNGFKLSLGGDWKPGGVGELSAEVDDAAGEESLTLTLPPGTTLAEGDLRQTAPKGLAIPGLMPRVTWKIRVESLGSLAMRVESSTGAARTATVTVAPKR